MQAGCEWQETSVDERILPERLAHATVVVSVYCRRCGYDVRGQRVDGRCPECGERVYPSVLALLDPDASRLPVLRDPARVGTGLLLIVGSALAAIVLSRVLPVLAWIDSLDPTSTGRFAGLVPSMFFVVAPMVLLLGLWGIHLLMPRDDDAGGRGPSNAAVRRDLALMRGGIIGSAAGLLIITWPGLRDSPSSADMFILLVTQFGLATAAIFTFIGLHRVLRAVGQRSRNYRKARGNRQGINALIAAVISVLIGRLCEIITPTFPLIGRAWHEWRSIGAAVVTIGYLMLIIGLTYLLVNVLWIRRSLRQAPPTLDEILLPPLPADTTIIGPDDDPDEPFTVRIKGEDD